MSADETAAEQGEHGVPDWLVAYLDNRDAQRTKAVETFLASLTGFQRHLVHDCAVMGYVRGMTHPAGKEIPKDSAITAEVIDACFVYPDLYPAVNATPEQRGQR